MDSKISNSVLNPSRFVAPGLRAWRQFLGTVDFWLGVTGMFDAFPIGKSEVEGKAVTSNQSLK